jgi:hypothetical protein
MVYGFNSLTGANLKNAKQEKESYSEEAQKVSFNSGSDEGTAIGIGNQEQIKL